MELRREGDFRKLHTWKISFNFFGFFQSLPLRSCLSICQEPSLQLLWYNSLANMRGRTICAIAHCTRFKFPVIITWITAGGPNLHKAITLMTLTWVIGRAFGTHSQAELGDMNENHKKGTTAQQYRRVWTRARRSSAYKTVSLQTLFKNVVWRQNAPEKLQAEAVVVCCVWFWRGRWDKIWTALWNKEV